VASGLLQVLYKAALGLTMMTWLQLTSFRVVSVSLLKFLPRHQSRLLSRFLARHLSLLQVLRSGPIEKIARAWKPLLVDRVPLVRAILQDQRNLRRIVSSGHPPLLLQPSFQVLFQCDGHLLGPGYTKQGGIRSFRMRSGQTTSLRAIRTFLFLLLVVDLLISIKIVAVLFLLWNLLTQLLFSHSPPPSRSPILPIRTFKPHHPHASRLSNSLRPRLHPMPLPIARTVLAQGSLRGVASLPIFTHRPSSHIQTSMVQDGNRVPRYVRISPRLVGKAEAAMTLTTRVERRVFARSQNAGVFSRI